MRMSVCVCVFVQKLIAHTLALICVYDGIHLKTYGLCSPRGALHFILYTFPKPFVGAPRLDHMRRIVAVCAVCAHVFGICIQL